MTERASIQARPKFWGGILEAEAERNRRRGDEGATVLATSSVVEIPGAISGRAALRLSPQIETEEEEREE